MFASFSSELPWSRCGNEWNTPNCVDFIRAAEKEAVNTTVNATVMPSMSTVPTSIAAAAKVSASEEYWE